MAKRIGMFGQVVDDAPQKQPAYQAPKNIFDTPSNAPKKQESDFVEDDPSGGKFNEYRTGGGSVPGTFKVPQLKYDDYLKNAVAARDKFSANKSQIGQGLMDSYSDSSRRQLAETMRGVKNDFNSRGLLGSGLEYRGRMGAVSDANAALLAKRQEVNRGLLDTETGLNRNIYDIADMSVTPGADLAFPYLENVRSRIAQMYDDATAQNQAYAGIASGLAGGVGTAIGKWG